MNTICLTLILVLNILVDKTYSLNTTGIEIKIDYNKTKTIVQNCLNGLLNALEIDVHVTRNPKMRLLQLMHNNLNNVVQHKWKVHSHMKEMAKAEFIVVPNEIYNFVEDAMSIIEHEHHNNKTNEIVDQFVDKDSTHFYAQLLNQINRQTITIEKLHNISKDGLKLESRRKMDDDLPMWEPDDEHQNYTRRMFHGKPVGITKYPFIVSVHVLGKFKGTGCIVSKKFVITAASCLQPSTTYELNPNQISVRMGSEHTSYGGAMLPVRKVIYHPQFDPVTLENNLAMMKVKNIMHTDARLRPAIKKIRIGNFPPYMPNDKGVFVLGWGDLKDTHKDRHFLASALLDIIPLDSCIDTYTRHYVTLKHFCSGLFYKQSGACNSDIGGPAIVSGNLVGIISFGPSTCGSSSSPTVFTKLDRYVSWINEVLYEDAKAAFFKSESLLTIVGAMNDQSLLGNPQSKDAEEMLILRQLVHDLDKPKGNTPQKIDVDPLDDEMKIIFQKPTTVDVPHHALVNKSIVLIPGVHYPSAATKLPDVTPFVTVPLKDIGLPDDIPFDFIEDMIKDSDELRYYVHEILKTGIFFKANKNEYLNKILRKIFHKPDSSDNFEYESTEGLSIEAPKGYNQNIRESNIRSRDRLNLKPETDDERVVFDLGNYQHNVDLHGPAYSTVPAKDIWSEVMRLKQRQKKFKRLKEWQRKHSYREDFRRSANKDKLPRIRSVQVYNLPRQKSVLKSTRK